MMRIRQTKMLGSAEGHAGTSIDVTAATSNDDQVSSSDDRNGRGWGLLRNDGQGSAVEGNIKILQAKRSGSVREQFAWEGGG
eukprot:758577-Hanusia_phi.AAC.3